MTKPTKAQIEAILDDLINLQPHIPQCCLPGKASFIDDHIDAAVDKLRAFTAAAEVGELDWRDAKIKTLENTAKINLAAYKSVKAATIERCAWRVDEKAAEIEAWSHQDDASRLAAEMLRKAASALKEKP